MIKLFMSQAMNGIDHDVLLEERQSVIDSFAAEFNDEVVDINWIDHIPGEENYSTENKSVLYIGKSIMLLAEADYIVFLPGWENARGCKVERNICEEYNLEFTDLALI